MTPSSQGCQFETMIARVIQETPRDRSFVLPIPASVRASFEFAPGQFVVIRDPEAQDARRRAYSISSAPRSRDQLEVTVRDMGTFGHTLYDFPVGKRLHVEGPRGRFVLDDSMHDLVLLAGGSGVAPFRSFVRHLAATESTRDVALFQSARRPEDLLFEDEFSGRAARDAHFRYRPTVTRTERTDIWPGATGRITAGTVAPLVPHPAHTQWYACGPAAFVAAVLSIAETLGVPAAQCHEEQWG